MDSPLISIIIPCYNAANYLNATLASVLSQDLSDFEIIVMDDGSTDLTKEVVQNVKDPRILYFHQNNQGVSVARNEGFIKSRGNSTVFFDADDLMTDNFLSGRFKALTKEPEFSFSSGEVIKFNDSGKLKGVFRGAANETEILLYAPEVVTCPSNYMFKKSFLEKNQLSFNMELSSTADRFFLIQCFRFGNGIGISGEGNLLYRVSDSSMSGKLNIKLVNDNERFYKLLLNSDLIHERIKNKSLFLGNYILSASYWKINYKLKSLKFAIRSFVSDPVMFIRKLL